MVTDPLNQEEVEKVVFTPEQQAKIDELVKARVGRANKQHEDRMSEVLTQLNSSKAELDEARKAAASATTPAEKKEAKGEVDALMAQIAEIKAAGEANKAEVERLRKVTADKDRDVMSARQEAVEIRKQIAIQAAAGKSNFYDVSMISKITSESVKFDETRKAFVVLNEDGQERMNSSYEPMTLEEFYTEYASKNPYLVRGDVRPGVGSTESQRSGLSSNGKFTVEQIFGPKSNAGDANTLKKNDPREYARLRAIHFAGK